MRYCPLRIRAELAEFTNMAVRLDIKVSPAAGSCHRQHFSGTSRGWNNRPISLLSQWPEVYSDRCQVTVGAVVLTSRVP